MQIKLGKPWRRKRDRIFILPYSTEPGKWRQKTLPQEITTKRDAEAWAAAWASEMIASGAEITTKKPAGGPTPRQLSEKWLGLREEAMRAGKLAPATVQDNRTHMERHVLPYLGDTPIAAIEVPQLRAWVRTLRGKVSASRCRNIYSTLANFIEDCMAEGWISVGANIVRHKAVTKELPEAASTGGAMVIPVEWVHALIESEKVPMERRVRYALAFTTGARDGELAGIRASDVELDASPPRMHIVRAVAVKGREGFATEKETKTKSSVRTVPLHPVAASLLRAWLDWGWERYVGRELRGKDFVFPRQDGEAGRPRSSDRIRDDLAELGLPTEIAGKRVLFKASRSTFVTWLAEAGVEEGIRQRLVGHSQSTVTSRHYTARELSVLHEAVGKLPLRLGGEPCFVDGFVENFVDAPQSQPPNSPETPYFPGAPGTNRTCDQRFRNLSPLWEDAPGVARKGSKSRAIAQVGSGIEGNSGKRFVENEASSTKIAGRVEHRIKARLAKCQCESAGVAEAAADVLREALGPARPDVLEGRLAAFAASMGGAS